MRKYEIKLPLAKTLNKIKKKDRSAYEQILRKIEEIITCTDVNHYKNMRAPLDDYKRVHIKDSFVLLFKYIKNEEKIIFCVFDHHDKVYK